MKKTITNNRVQRSIIVSYIITGLILTGILSVTYSYLLSTQIIKDRYNQADAALQVATSQYDLIARRSLCPLLSDFSDGSANIVI
jgi:hypothetical protein